MNWYNTYDVYQRDCMDQAVEHICQLLQTRHVFLTGGAGTGKSYTTAAVIKELRNKSKEVVALGSTGVSAVNIGGFTLHSFFAFGIASNFEELMEQDRRQKKKIKQLHRLIASFDVIVIDEISMVSAMLMEMIYYRLESAGFCGQLLFVGDFFQLPPVQKNHTKHLFSQALYAFESEAWKQLNPACVELTTIKRTTDATFAQVLANVRFGKCDAWVCKYLSNLRTNQVDEHATRLYGRNEEVEQVNRYHLMRLHSEETILFAQIQEYEDVSPSRMQSWLRALPVQKMLTLKVGAPVLFTVNKWGKYVNGERGVVAAINEDVIVIAKDDTYVHVERHEFEMYDIAIDAQGELQRTIRATLLQYPLRLAYAITIHKSQGMSIEALSCNVDRLFAASQFYVAISRAIDPNRLHIEYTRDDWEAYLKRVVRVDERVKHFYAMLRTKEA